MPPDHPTDPTPATPDEAVAALDDSLRYVGDRAGAPRRRYAEMLLANLPAGWSLSRQQGDTVAARAEDVARRYAARNWDAMSPVMQEHFLDVARRLLGMDGDK